MRSVILWRLGELCTVWSEVRQRFVGEQAYARGVWGPRDFFGMITSPLAVDAISILVEAVRVGRQDLEVLVPDVWAVQVRRRPVDADGRVGRVALFRRGRGGGRGNGFSLHRLEAWAVRVWLVERRPTACERQGCRHQNQKQEQCFQQVATSCMGAEHIGVATMWTWNRALIIISETAILCPLPVGLFQCQPGFPARNAV